MDEIDLLEAFGFWFEIPVALAISLLLFARFSRGSAYPVRAACFAAFAGVFVSWVVLPWFSYGWVPRACLYLLGVTVLAGIVALIREPWPATAWVLLPMAASGALLWAMFNVHVSI